jgi:hypothetical protein
MRVNIYSEEITDRVEIVEKTINGQTFTGVRFYLELPVTENPGRPGEIQHKGPFIHGVNDDDSSAITFWGKGGLHSVLQKALLMLDEHYDKTHPRKVETI